MRCVYVLRSQSRPTKTYTGLTDNVDTRLIRHNKGDVPYTSKYRPWLLETWITFTSTEKAAEFERYLKTGSGRAFAKKHFG